MEFNISFEYFPPKTAQGKKTIVETTQQLAQSNPAFFSVTYGAGGSTRSGTLETITLLQQITHVPVVPHLSCVGATSQETIDVLEVYKKLGAKRIIALRGDLPFGLENSGDLKYAADLVKLIRDTTGDYFHIEVAAYPEIHPQSHNAQSDVSNLKRKMEAGANSAITQYFFNPDAYFYFLDDCANAKINIPIVPGIMPISSFEKLARFSAICGAEIPRWLRKRLESYSGDEESMQKFALEVVHNHCLRLVAGGAPGLHFYTLNQHEPTQSILKLLKASFPERRAIKNVDIKHKNTSSIVQK